jgi:multiphosphoryl transfer protein
MPETTITVTEAHGLHARPAALFVQTAARFTSSVQVKNLDRPAGRTVDAKSMLGVTALRVSQGQRILISAEGDDAASALVALRHLVESDFTIGPEDATPLRSSAAGHASATPQPALSAAAAPDPVAAAETPPLRGVGAAPGIAVGPIFCLRTRIASPEFHTVADPGAELERFCQVRERTRDELRALHDRVIQTTGADEAAIFAAHLAFLDDPTLAAEITTFCEEQKLNLEAAVVAVLDQHSATLHQSHDPIFQARAADLQDLKQRLLRLLLDPDGQMFALPEQPCVVLAQELLPSEAAMLDRTRVLAFCTADGGPTSHVAILARGMGLPAVVGVGPAILAVPDGTLAIVDGKSGKVILNPSETLVAMARKRAQSEQARREQQRAVAQQVTVTRDDRRIEVVANVGSLAEVNQALAEGAEGVGLLRTEFLFVDRATAPDEEEQLAQYRACAALLAERPLIIRTLDIGSDKPVRYLKTATEQNPALGMRGIRLLNIAPELLRTQLRAIWRIDSGHNIKVMFPMVSSIDEIRTLRQLVAEIATELRQEGQTIAERLDIGIMVETPAIALLAEAALTLVDFLSIGTNDLTQYTLAADRINAAVNYLNDAFHPAVLHLIAQTARAAHNAGKWAGVCGEMAGDPLAQALLVGLGITELSMSSALIPAAKATIRQISLADAQTLARQALELDTPQNVRNFLAQQIAPADG